jgi:hypothetical protein
VEGPQTPDDAEIDHVYLVEEFDGTALLTTRGIEAAALFSPTK